MDQILDKVKTVAAEVAAKHAADVDARARFPHESVEALRRSGPWARRAHRAGRPRRRHARARARCARRSRQPAARAAWCSPCTTSRSPASRATALASPFFRELPARARRAAALSPRSPPRSASGGDTRSQHLRGRARRRPLQARQGRDHRLLRRARRRPPRHLPPRRRTRRRATRCWCSCARTTTRSTQTDDLGHAGHARHLQPRLQADVRGPRGADPARRRSPTRRRRRWCRSRTSSGRRCGSGIAADAVGARARVRARARRARSRAPCRRRRTRLAEAVGAAAADAQQRARRSPPSSTSIMRAADGHARSCSTIGWALKMNNLKVVASETAPQIVHEALQIIGIIGYKNDSQVQRRPPLPRRAVGGAHDLQRPHLRQERVDAARAQGRLSADGRHDYDIEELLRRPGRARPDHPGRRAGRLRPRRRVRGRARALQRAGHAASRRTTAPRSCTFPPVIDRTDAREESTTSTRSRTCAGAVFSFFGKEQRGTRAVGEASTRASPGATCRA